MIILDLAYLEFIEETSIVGGSNDAIGPEISNALGVNTKTSAQTKTAVFQCADRVLRRCIPVLLQTD
jgi:hypothetical protein